MSLTTFTALTDSNLNSYLLGLLACPRTGAPLYQDGNFLVSEEGTRYPVVEGIPVFLPEEFGESGSGAASHTRAFLKGAVPHSEVFLSQGNDEIEPLVQQYISAAGGNLYRRLIGKLKSYPIPEFPVTPEQAGALLIDIGCHWGRWTIGASRKGFTAIGIDPSLEAVIVAKRIADKLGARAHFIAGDGRFLPFRRDTADFIFSFSVLQHFARSDVARTLEGVKRILRPGGRVMAQMPNRRSILGMKALLQRGFQDGRGFQVRYWTHEDLKRTFGEILGEASVEVDSFFSINAQEAAIAILPWVERMILRLSLGVTNLSKKVKPLQYFADSLYVHARKADNSRPKSIE